MTFQKKYAEKRREAYKVFNNALKQCNAKDCADAIFKAIYDELDKKVAKEYDAKRIEKLERNYLDDRFSVSVKFYQDYVVVSGDKVKLPCNAIVNEDEIKKILKEKLQEVGVSFEQKDITESRAVLKFEDSDGWNVKKTSYPFRVALFFSYCEYNKVLWYPTAIFDCYVGSGSYFCKKNLQNPLTKAKK